MSRLALVAMVGVEAQALREALRAGVTEVVVRRAREGRGGRAAA